MMIDAVRQDTGIVPLFAANLDEFRVTIPRSSPVTPEFLAWAGRVTSRNLTKTQLAALALARDGHDIDQALLCRLGLEPGQARRQLGELADEGLLRSRRAKDPGPYRLDPAVRAVRDASGPPSLPGNGLGERIVAVLHGVDDASREEIQHATDSSRTQVTRVLQQLADAGYVEAVGPPRSPNRRYRLAEGRP